MAITIKAYDANKDGKGINFTSYLANYEKTFVPSGYGSFNSTDPMAMSGSQYAATNAKGYGVFLTSGKSEWDYDIITHTVKGSLNSVTFANSIKLNSATKFTGTLDLEISGLNITKTALGGEILSDLRDASTTSLVKVLKANSINFTGSTGSDTFTGYSKADKIYGGSGNDLLKGGAGNDTVSGDSGNDKVYGGSGNDKVYGGSGNDYLYGDSGNDVLDGGSGNDTLYGGAGNDKLTGGAGNDKLYGGSGSDIFVFAKNSGNDTIYDFDAGSAKTDVIWLDKSVLKNFSAVLDHATDTRSGVEIEYGSATITLKGVDYDDLHKNDFLFV
ncbi:hypothetical protein [Sinorhizobium sp. BG8]|uniref:calcium-binding protein n=1 Tax=Sinorhizobium sp. BG8 TaxID=2613773 RepID=UPI00193D8539|nr:hypothetical protein [Sinorhizobium sp. BG8]QRM54615.1 calcium-binding protein [Sinorhizobium sp. BG8]